MPAKNTSRKPPWEQQPSRKVRSFVSSPLTWISAIVVGGIAIALAISLQPQITGVLNRPSQIVPAVEVSAFVRPANGDMWLPSGMSLDTEDLTALNQMDATEQRTWLADHGASSLGWRDVELQLKGNHPEPVQITDIRPVSTCSEHVEGSWVLLAGPYGNPPDTTRMLIAADEPDEPPVLLNMEAPESGQQSQLLDVRTDPNQGPPAFFESRDIILDQGETEPLMISLNSQDTMCAVDLELTVLENGQSRTQKVFGEGRELIVGPQNSGSFRDKIESIYLGGEICHSFVERAPEEVERRHRLEYSC